MAALTEKAAAMHAELDRKKAEGAKALREKYNAIETFKMPMAVTIKSYNGNPVCGPRHFGTGPGTRKIFPGEVICIDAGDPEIGPLFKTFEPTTKPITRPLVYANSQHALATTPNPKVRANFSEGELKRYFAQVRDEVLQLNSKLQARKAELQKGESHSPEVQQAVEQQRAAEIVESTLTEETETEGGGRRRRTRI